MRVVWTERAVRRLGEIHDHVAKDAPAAASALVARLVRRSRQIARMPRAGRVVPELRRTDLREALERPYRIIYLIGSDRIDILTIVHYRQLLPDDLS
jgi:plasmid stabilization system protein ParE